MPNGWLGFEHWVLDGLPWSKNGWVLWFTWDFQKYRLLKTLKFQSVFSCPSRLQKNNEKSKFRQFLCYVWPFCLFFWSWKYLLRFCSLYDNQLNRQIEIMHSRYTIHFYHSQQLVLYALAILQIQDVIDIRHPLL